MKNNYTSRRLILSGVHRFLAGKVCALLATITMLFAVIVVYWSPAIPNSVLVGSDYIELHSRRMQYARDALFGRATSLPAWYPRELLGTPFWSNIQNFPFIPTRLVVLMTMEPNGLRTYGNAITLSALLAALFTYLYLRKIGLGLTAAAAAGWTFACSGYYASRVAAGHLPLLEAYPALPLLMWVTESLLQALECGRSSRRWLAVIAIASACVMLAGHPQLPIYAIAVASVYALWRGRFPQTLWVWSGTVIGVAIAGFALAPMAMLVGRSTRVLSLVAPSNDLSMPYGRLAAFFLPWRDGVPPLLDSDRVTPFTGYPSLAYFWDTVCYTGLLPWVSIALLFCYSARSELGPIGKRIALFMVLLGVAGIALSLPFIRQVTALIPGTFFRSPARVIYLTEFALAIALGTAVHWAMATVRPMISRAIVPLLLLVHVVDLGIHDRRFILRGSLDVPPKEAEIIRRTLEEVGDGRVAIDYALALPQDRTVDDVGFFDSIMLARPYRLVLDLAGAPPESNVQTFNGSEISLRGLAALGVKFVLTPARMDNLRSEGQVLGINIYRVPSPAPRAEFFDLGQIQYLSIAELHARLRDPKTDLRSTLLLPRHVRMSETAAVTAKSSEPPTVEYRRLDSDSIECTVTTGRSGYLRIIESWDPGWSATVDGKPVLIVPGMDALLAVPISPGRHVVQFVYRTPGAGTGLAISFTGLVLLGGFMWAIEKRDKRQLRCVGE
jgi:hypothetical protein